MDELIDLIMHEGDFHPSEEVVRQLLALGEEVHFGPKKAVIEFGHINRNVYIVKEGILRGSASRRRRRRPTDSPLRGRFCFRPTRII